MFCPNCGVTIGDVGSFCARCGKDVAYLRQPALSDVIEDTIVSAEESEQEKEKDTAAPAAEPEAPKENLGQSKDRYFCNSCGTAVFGKDNYCWKCGKLLAKKYYRIKYKKIKFNTKYIAAAGIAVIFIIAAVVAYCKSL
ncbi:MAG: Double zinc ribbon [Firmicutes bacterium]|nr:Double zinc ribbon [Bacillota bacterium]